MSWITPKTDWQPTDNYNYDSLNRVEKNIATVCTLFTMFALISKFTVVTHRKMDHIEFADSLNRIEKNLSTLAQRYKPTGWVASKTDWQSNDPFDYRDANRLEHNVYLLYQYYWNNTLNFNYCGDYTCGEDGI